jgi:hypothetical protein
MSDDQIRQDETRGDLAFLRVHDPDRIRDARVRTRCHAALEKRHRLARRSLGPAWGRGLEPALVGSLCAAYLLDVLGRAVHLYPF